MRLLVCLCLATFLNAQQTPALKERPAAPADGYQVDAGTHILLNMINSVSTKQAVVGDRLYLETAFPVISNGKIIVPQGSWVTGTVTEVRRGARGVKGRRSELQVRFDSLTLPNGVTRNFRSDLGSLDAENTGKLDREHDEVKGPSDKGTVARTTAEGAVIGAGIGGLATRGAATGPLVGLGAGAAAGLVGVLFTRGPDAVLPRGSSVEMILDRPIVYSTAELDLTGAPARGGTVIQAAPAPAARSGWPLSRF